MKRRRRNPPLICLKAHKIGHTYAMEGLKKAEWNGRFQIISKQPLFIGDGAHNEDAALKCLELYDFDTVLFPFNWFMNMEHGMGSRLIRSAKERNMGVLGMKAFIERKWNSPEERNASPQIIPMHETVP